MHMGMCENLVSISLFGIKVEKWVKKTMEYKITEEKWGFSTKCIYCLNANLKEHFKIGHSSFLRRH